MASPTQQPAISNPQKGIYSRLAENEIRLLLLHPGAYSDELKCTLEHITLAAAGEIAEYDALSYTWGAAHERRSIHFDTALDFPVTDNLWHALQRLRDPQGVRRLWIDAVCIDQRDLAERAEQIRFMYAIFQRARRVVVWLGEPLREPLEAYAVEGKAGWTEQMSSSSLGMISAFPREKRSRSVQKRLFCTAVVKAWRSTQPHWWDRTWILQEVVANAHVEVQCGALSFPWETFAKLADLYFRRRRVLFRLSWKDLEVMEEFVSKIVRIAMLREQYLRCTVPAKRLADVVPLGRASQCSERKDKVFALLGMMDAKLARAIEVDYSAGWEEVYTRATFASIRVEGNLNIWSLIEPGSHSSDLPSWVVDFDSDGRKFNGFRKIVHKADEEPELSHVGGAGAVSFLALDRAGLPSLSDDCRHLKVHGRSFGTAEKFCDPWEEKGKTSWFNMLSFMEQAADRKESLRTTFQKMADSSQTGEAREIKLTEPLSSKSFAFFRRLHHFISSTPDARKRITCAMTGWEGAVGATMKDADIRAACGVWMQYAFREGAVLFTTREGFIGVANDLQSSDHVVLVKGCGLPVVLRPDGENWTFRGLAYVHGVVAAFDCGSGLHDAGAKIVDFWWECGGMEDRGFVLA